MEAILNIDLNYSTPFFLGITVGILLGVLAIKKSFPIFSVRNIVIFMVLLYTVLGILLLPYSLDLDKFNVADSQTYLSSINKSVVYHILGLWFFLLPIIILDKKWVKPINKTAFLKLLSYPERINYSQSAKILILALFVLLGSAAIYGTFWHISNIPYCNLLDPSAKYFSGLTEKYIKVRPFYVFGQQLLAVTGFFLLYFFIKILQSKEFKKAIIFLLLFIFSFFPLLLTMKRGEAFFPLVMYTGGLILLNRIKIVHAAVIAIALIWSAFLMDPSQHKMPLTNLICSEVVQETQKVSSKEEAQSLKKIILNSFFTQVRDSSRLIYNFNYKKESYFYGKTFLASALGFIPTTIFPFKEKNQIGRVTLRLFGINPETSGGARIGIIGESYINFGFLCVVIPLFLGIFFWFLDRYYLWFYENYSGDHKLLHMSLMFIILTHLGIGLYLDGSGALQTFIIRATLFAIIIFSLLPLSDKKYNG